MDILEQTKPNKNKWISFLADGVLSGLMLGIGGMVSLSSENRFLGAFLFSLGCSVSYSSSMDYSPEKSDTLSIGICPMLQKLLSPLWATPSEH